MIRNKILRFLWNFNWYRLTIFKIEKYQLNNIFRNNKWHIVCLDSIDLQELKTKIFYNRNIPKFWDDNKIQIIKKRDFIKWFETNKNSKKRILFINNLFHCKYEYRYIRFNGFESFILK